MAALIVMGAGALVAAGGQFLSAGLQSKAAKSQAQTQKRAANRYAKALRGQASRLHGGLSQSMQQTQKTAGSLDQNAMAQQARDELKRGGGNASADVEVKLQESMQLAGGQQQQGLDALSAQTANKKAQMKQGLAAQGQAIDPNAQAQAARAQGIGAGVSTLGSAAMGLAQESAGQQLQAGALQGQMASLDGVDFSRPDVLSQLKTAEQKAAYVTLGQQMGRGNYGGGR
jgi:hypothetical protein